MSVCCPYNRPRCCNTGGGFLFLCVLRDLLSGIDAFEKFLGALNRRSTNPNIIRNLLCGIVCFWQRSILNLCHFRVLVPSVSSVRHFLRLILPANQICLLRAY